MKIMARWVLKIDTAFENRLGGVGEGGGGEKQLQTSEARTAFCTSFRNKTKKQKQKTNNSNNNNKNKKRKKKADNQYQEAGKRQKDVQLYYIHAADDKTPDYSMFAGKR